MKPIADTATSECGRISPRVLRVCGAILGVLIAAGCKSSDDPAELESHLLALNRKLALTGESGDSDMAVSMHTDDAVLIPPSGRIVVDREQVVALLSNSPDVPLRDSQVEFVRTGSSGDLAYTVGRFSYVVEQGESSRTVSGPYLIVWRRGEDGEWRVELDMWNLDR